MEAAAPAIPAKPSTPATNAITKNMTAHLIIFEITAMASRFNAGFV